MMSSHTLYNVTYLGPDCIAIQNSTLDKTPEIGPLLDLYIMAKFSFPDGGRYRGVPLYVAWLRCLLELLKDLVLMYFNYV